MRLWLVVLVAVILAPFGIAPAVADGMSFHSHSIRPGFVSRHHRHFNRFDRSHAFGIADNGFFGSGLVGNGFFGDAGFGLPAEGTTNPAYIIVASSGAPMPMSRPVAEERPTVETTASGVAIIRGPGSHHLSR
jgi:hypothetical protein